MLNLNPVIVAKHFNFQYGVETFFREVLVTIKTKPIGKIVYFALRIEFQMQWSPHLLALIWCDVSLPYDNKQAYIKYVDKQVGRRS